MNNLNYAIETLEIELNRLKEIIRTIDKQEIEATTRIPVKDEYYNKLNSIQEAINILKEKNK